MLPSDRLAEQVVKLGLLNINNIAVVVPAFEIHDSIIDLPTKKDILLKYIPAGAVRPFYDTVCKPCHAPTNNALWKFDGETTYEVEWKSKWEPFYVARKELVHYDERFERYGYNR